MLKVLAADWPCPATSRFGHQPPVGGRPHPVALQLSDHLDDSPCLLVTNYETFPDPGILLV